MNLTCKSLDSFQLKQIEQFGISIKGLGYNFILFDSDGKHLVSCFGDKFSSDLEQLQALIDSLLSQIRQKQIYREQDITIYEFNNPSRILAIPLCLTESGSRIYKPAAVAMIDMGYNQSDSENSCCCPSEMQPADFDKGACFAEMLRLFADKFHTKFKAEQQIEQIGTELSRVYEELVLLHKLSTNMKLTEMDSSFLQMACDSLTEIVFVEGIAILLDKVIDNEQQLVVAAGSGLIDIDEQTSIVLYNRLVEEINRGNDALLDSEVDSPFKYEWPANIKNIIAVPLCGKEKTGSSIIGLMVAVNRIGKRDFDSTDIKLFDSVASGCAVFIENGRLFKDLKELFIGSLKALTTSIDAKDNYTHGHSERVAFISRWIAEKLSVIEPMDEEQIHQIYLAGLLHDIGKIGIDESVLRKSGRLTNDEFESIRVHPSIGAGILREIKQMREIVFGVQCHHERIDGKGYPNGLVGDEIPLIGKIVGLADSFDAMTSKRTYRDAMSVERALEEIEKNLGTQFDEKIGRIFIQSDVYQLWENIRDGYGELFRDNASNEYDAAAVETLIR